MVFVYVSVLALYLSWSLSWYMSISLCFVCLYTTIEPLLICLVLSCLAVVLVGFVWLSWSWSCLTLFSKAWKWNGLMPVRASRLRLKTSIRVPARLTNRPNPYPHSNPNPWLLSPKPEPLTQTRTRTLTTHHGIKRSPATVTFWKVVPSSPCSERHTHRQTHPQTGHTDRQHNTTQHNTTHAHAHRRTHTRAHTVTLWSFLPGLFVSWSLVSWCFVLWSFCARFHGTFSWWCDGVMMWINQALLWTLTQLAGLGVFYLRVIGLHSKRYSTAGHVIQFAGHIQMAFHRIV